MSKENDNPNPSDTPFLKAEERLDALDVYNDGVAVYYDGVDYYWRALDCSDARHGYVSSGVGRSCMAVRIDYSLHGPMRSIEAFEATAKAIYRMTMASDHPCYCDGEGA